MKFTLTSRHAADRRTKKNVVKQVYLQYFHLHFMNFGPTERTNAAFVRNTNQKIITYRVFETFCSLLYVIFFFIFAEQLYHISKMAHIIIRKSSNNSAMILKYILGVFLFHFLLLQSAHRKIQMLCVYKAKHMVEYVCDVFC